MQRSESFIYDALGNRKGVNQIASLGSVTMHRRDNGVNEYLDWTHAGISYENNGNLYQDGWISASYNALNQPISIWSWRVNPTGNSVSFGYDPLGRCVKRWTSGSASDPYYNPATYFVYDGWNLLQEGASPWYPARVYVHGGRVDEIIYSINTQTGASAFHQYDARGHCTLLTDNSGAITEQYQYDAFGYPYFFGASGNALLNGSVFGNRFLFTGREWIKEIAVYDFRNRHYLPELGRFIQPDPKEFAAGDYNLYRYCHNDPVNHFDPTGLDWKVNPAMSAEYQRRTLDQITRSRALHPDIDQKFRNMENNHRVMDVITEAGPKGNRTETRYNWLGNPIGATLYFNPDNWKADSGYRDPIIGLIHELSHVEHGNVGTLEKQLNQRGLAQEAEAIRLENIARRLIDGSHRDENYIHTGPTSITYPDAIKQ